MSPKRSDGRALPLHAQIFQELRNDIQNGKYPIGSLLPKEHELAAQFTASRQTVRHAIESLRRLGLVSSQRGVGSRIENARATHPFSYSAHSIEDLLYQATETRLRPLTRASLTVGARFAASLGVRAPRHWIQLGCLRYIRDEQRPMCWTDIYIDGRLQNLVSGQDPILTPIFPRIEEAIGTRLTKIHQQVRAILLGPALLEHLDVKPPGSALEISRRYVFGERVMLVSINTLPADRFSYSVDIFPATQAESVDPIG